MPPQQAYGLLDLVDDVHDLIAHMCIPLEKFGPSIMFGGPDVKSDVFEFKHRGEPGVGT
jgi:hypothetical protein